MAPLTGLPLHRAVQRALVNPRALRNLKDQHRRRRATLLDPKAGDSCKKFPLFKPGMRTADYVRMFQKLNAGSVPYRENRSEYLTFVHADRAAPMLDPSIPEVEHEVLP
jgi:hypothetical protein